MSGERKPVVRSRMPLLATLVIGLAGGVLISNYTILGESLDFRSSGNKMREFDKAIKASQKLRHPAGHSLDAAV